MREELISKLEKELAEATSRLSGQREIADESEEVGSAWKYDADYLQELEEEVERLQYRISVLKIKETYEDFYSSYQELLRDALLKHEVKVSEDRMTVTGKIPLDVQYIQRIPELSKHREELIRYANDDVILFNCSVEYSDTCMFENAVIKLIATSPYCSDLSIILDSLSHERIEEIAKNVCEAVGI